MRSVFYEGEGQIPDSNRFLLVLIVVLCPRVSVCTPFIVVFCTTPTQNTRAHRNCSFRPPDSKTQQNTAKQTHFYGKRSGAKLVLPRPDELSGKQKVQYGSNPTLHHHKCLAPALLPDCRDEARTLYHPQQCLRPMPIPPSHIRRVFVFVRFVTRINTTNSTFIAMEVTPQRKIEMSFLFLVAKSGQ